MKSHWFITDNEQQYINEDRSSKYECGQSLQKDKGYSEQEVFVAFYPPESSGHEMHVSAQRPVRYDDHPSNHAMRHATVLVA